jgi:hypothetical protein
VFDRVEHVILVRARLADGAAHRRGRVRGVEPPGILIVRAVDDITQRLAARAGGKGDRQHALQIDMGDEFAGAQIVEHLLAQVARHPKGKPDTRSAPVEAEHEARPRRRAAMHERAHAQRPAVAVQARALGLEMGESGPPHQRTVAKHPKIAHIALPVWKNWPEAPAA